MPHQPSPGPPPDQASLDSEINELRPMRNIDAAAIPRRSAAEKAKYEFSEERMRAEYMDESDADREHYKSEAQKVVKLYAPPADLPESEERPRNGLQFLTADDLDALPEPYDFVRHVLYDNQLIVIYGEPGSGKSFYALDLCARAGLGLSWFGRDTEERRSLYIALEGTGGLKRRLHAWRVHNRQPVPPMTFATGLLALGTDKKARTAIVRHVRATGARIVVIDTVARAMPGANENDSADMGAMIAGADQIRRSTGATVLLIAHSGKDASRGVRGHSSLKGAADVEIEIIRNGEQRLGRVTKSKDGIEGVEFPFILQQVETGLIDARGEPITSAAVSECEAFDDLDAELSKRDQQALDALSSITPDKPELMGLPSLDAWRDAVRLAWGDMKPATFRQAWKRTRETLEFVSAAVPGEHYE